MKVKKQRVIFFYIIAELLLLHLSFGLVSFYKYGTVFHYGNASLLLIYNLSWLAVLMFRGSQTVYIKGRFSTNVKERIINAFLFLGISFTFILLFNQDELSRTMIFGTVSLFFLLNSAFFLLSGYLAGSHSRGKFGSRLLILGAEERGKQVLDFTLKNKHLGYDVVGFLDDYKIGSNGVNIIGKIHDLPKVLEDKYVDEIVIALPSYKEDDIKYVMKTADYNGIRVNLIPDFITSFSSSYKAYNIDELPVIEMQQIPLDRFHNFFMKKVFDVIFASTVLILLSPILTLIAILIKLDSKGPIFYKPVRKGQQGKEFTCFKFRSMYVENSDNPSAGTRSTVKDDPRITKIGKYLRKYDLDELPQFINVLKGDMSVVGPRPHRVHLNNQLQKMVDGYMLRHYVKPGITGWAQVNGWRGPTETEEQKRERVKHDLWYVTNWSFWLDIKIVFLTVFSKKTRINAF